MDLSRARDTSRIIESMVQLGTEAQRWIIFAELRDRLRYLAMSQYGKHVVLKLINYGAKEHRVELLKVHDCFPFSGSVSSFNIVIYNTNTNATLFENVPNDALFQVKVHNAVRLTL